MSHAGSPRQLKRRQTPHPAVVSQTLPAKTQVDFTKNEASATDTSQQSQHTTVKGTKESNVSLESGYASNTDLKRTDSLMGKL